MTNNITSSKTPPVGKRFDIDQPAFVGDAILDYENEEGEMGRLSDIQAQTMANLSDSERAEMFAESGIKMPRRPMQW
jgi:uncharacterized phosphosugar-binding protein